MDTWQQQNLNTIKHRLGWLYEKKDGVLCKHLNDDGSSLIIRKDTDTLSLYFIAAADDSQKPLVSGVMSRINIKNPLYLQGIYQQAMLLSVLFVEQPQQIYIMGFGGGCLPLVLHHYYQPNLTIHGSEIQNDVLTIAGLFFGVTLDHYQLAIQDGREHLAQSTTIYDIIIIDCFADEGLQPYQLATQEFYQLCQAHLSPNGVVSTNLAMTDPLFEHKKNTFFHSFQHVYKLRYKQNYILFGSNNCDINTIKIQQRAVKMMRKKQIKMPLDTLSMTIKKLTLEPKTITNILVDVSIN